MLINISLFGQLEKCFIFRNDKSIDLKNINLKTLQFDENVSYTSVIQTDETEKLFVKITYTKYGQHNEARAPKVGTQHANRKPNKFKFILREIIAERLLLTVRSLKEYRDSKKLTKMGINTAKVYGAGYFLTSINTFNSIIIYEKLEGLVSAQEVLLTSDSIEVKRLLLKKIELDYKRMAWHKLHFRDMHMSNVLYDEVTQEIYWIDPSFDRISRF